MSGIPDGADPPRKTPGASRDFARCVKEWGRMVKERRLCSPRNLLGARLHFADGSSSFVFRETAVRDVATREPVVLLIQFRLAVLGANGLLHAAFRRECVLHTPLFAGFPGFRSKLWIDDVDTGVYRGLYEWDGTSAATHYAHRMVSLLAPFSNKGTALSHVVEGLARDEFLSAPGGAGDAWWQLARPMRSPEPDRPRT